MSDKHSFSEQFLRELKEQGSTSSRTVYVFDVIDSTSSELKRRLERGAGAGTVVVAEMQRQGRGRRGRTWWSEPGGNLYLSIAVALGEPLQDKAPLLPLAAGVAVGLASPVAMLLLRAYGLLGATELTACMFVHATGMGIVIPVASAEAIRPYDSSAGVASALLGFLQMAGAVVGTLATSWVAPVLGRYAFPEVMLSGALLATVTLVLSVRYMRAASTPSPS